MACGGGSRIVPARVTATASATLARVCTHQGRALAVAVAAPGRPPGPGDHRGSGATPRRRHRKLPCCLPGTLHATNERVPLIGGEAQDRAIRVLGVTDP